MLNVKNCNGCGKRIMGVSEVIINHNYTACAKTALKKEEALA
ncbi:MAG: hypothetical protein ACQCN5_08240 [Candidatus Bathyarchaeia archaeon]|jgi:hypothetical protein